MKKTQALSPNTGSPQFGAADEWTLADENKLDLAVQHVAQQKANWCRLSCQQRIDLLESVIESLKSGAEDWVAASCRAKGHQVGTPSAGEEWLTGPFIVARNLRLLRDSIRQIKANGVPKLPGQPFVRDNGQVVAPVFPTSLFDRLLFMGYQGEVWMDPAVTLVQLPSTMAVNYQQSTANSAANPGALCLVLGAGNVSAIGPMDALYKLFVENQVVIVKMNPVNEYLTPPFNRAFQPLIEAGFLKFVTGGNQAGKFLCEHSSVDEIHITGSDKTHDAIVFGAGAAGAERKQQRSPSCDKRVTSELGNVSPVIIVPGQWSNADIAFQAQNVATMLVNNAGFNCNSIRVLITHKDWPQRDAFLAALKSVFEKTPRRRAYYPGADDRFETFTRDRTFITKGGKKNESDNHTLPWTVIENLDSGNEGEICFNSEAFCSVMGETSLPGNTVAEYLQHAVEFANEHVWGSLNVTLIVSPKTLKVKEIAETFDQAISDLRFGTVAVNHWAGINFGLGSTTWGAFPGHPPHDIQSGAGVVHNTFMFDQAQKTVLRGPFRPFPKPAWFANHSKTHKLGPAMFHFECAPSWLRLPAITWYALG